MFCKIIRPWLGIMSSALDFGAGKRSDEMERSKTRNNRQLVFTRLQTPVIFRTVLNVPEFAHSG